MAQVTLNFTDVVFANIALAIRAEADAVDGLTDLQIIKREIRLFLKSKVKRLQSETAIKTISAQIDSDFAEAGD